MHYRNVVLCNKLLLQNKTKFLFLLTGLTFVLSTALATADDYLDALQNEASHLPYLESSKSLSVSITISEFEKSLELKKPGAASIYRRLNTADRVRIYKTYKATLDYSKTEQLIHQLYLDRNK